MASAPCTHHDSAANPADRHRQYKPVVAALLNEQRPRTILDIGAGDGWLRQRLDYSPEIDAADWSGQPLPGYRNVYHADLNTEAPGEPAAYDCVVCCEVIAYLANPGLLLSGVNRLLRPGGRLVLSTPNCWYAQSRLQFLLKGFFPSFPSLVGRLAWGTHMHLIPWSFPQLYQFMTLYGFSEVTLHDVPEARPKHWLEWLIGAPTLLYGRWRLFSAKTEEERRYWKHAGSRQSILGRRLVVTAVKQDAAP